MWIQEHGRKYMLEHRTWHQQAKQRNTTIMYVNTLISFRPPGSLKKAQLFKPFKMQSFLFVYISKASKIKANSIWKTHLYFKSNGTSRAFERQKQRSSRYWRTRLSLVCVQQRMCKAIGILLGNNSPSLLGKIRLIKMLYLIITSALWECHKHIPFQWEETHSKVHLHSKVCTRRIWVNFFKL